MTKPSKEQEAIIKLLTRIYGEIVEIEQEYKLFAGAGDMRPRIDYFHDAVRAFTSESESHKRLSVELLAYDISCLNYIVKMPTSPFREDGENLSPDQSLMTTVGDLMETGNSIDRKTKSRISELYQNYAVMFAALLKPTADHDFKERTETLNNEVSDINSIIQQFAKTTINTNTIVQLTNKLEERELKLIIMTFLQQKKQEKPAEITKLTGHLNNVIKAKDKTIKTIDAAHMKYATTQLAVFEESRDMLKKLAAQGTNIVGKFVESSIATTRRQMGR